MSMQQLMTCQYEGDNNVAKNAFHLVDLHLFVVNDQSDNEFSYA